MSMNANKNSTWSQQHNKNILCISRKSAQYQISRAALPPSFINVENIRHKIQIEDNNRGNEYSKTEQR